MIILIYNSNNSKYINYSNSNNNNNNNNNNFNNKIFNITILKQYKESRVNKNKIHLALNNSL